MIFHYTFISILKTPHSSSLLSLPLSPRLAPSSSTLFFLLSLRVFSSARLREEGKVKVRQTMFLTLTHTRPLNLPLNNTTKESTSRVTKEYNFFRSSFNTANHFCYPFCNISNVDVIGSMLTCSHLLVYYYSTMGGKISR